MNIQYKPQQKTILVTADELSHSPLKDRDNTAGMIIVCHINTVTHCWPISQHKLDMIRSAKQRDEQLQSARKLIKAGWA